MFQRKVNKIGGHSYLNNVTAEQLNNESYRIFELLKPTQYFPLQTTPSHTRYRTVNVLTSKTRSYFFKNQRRTGSFQNDWERFGIRLNYLLTCKDDIDGTVNIFKSVFSEHALLEDVLCNEIVWFVIMLVTR